MHPDFDLFPYSEIASEVSSSQSSIQIGGIDSSNPSSAHSTRAKKQPDYMIGDGLKFCGIYDDYSALE